MANERKILSERQTVEIDPEDHKRALDEVNERYSDPLAIMSILQAIRADQQNAARDRKSEYRHVADALGEQSAAVNRLSMDVSGLSIRTATIEVEQQKHAVVLGLVKERQDGCVARVTHDADNTEIRDLRAQLQKAVTRRLTPPHGIKLPSYFPRSSSAGNWWSSNTGKILLGALAGLLVAIANLLAPWASLSSDGPQIAPARPHVVRPIRSVPDRAIADSDLDDIADTLDGRRGAVTP
jgi:hypothetical protein